MDPSTWRSWTSCCPTAMAPMSCGRSRRPAPETRVAVLSSALDLSGALAAGADEVVGKVEDLQETVATLARLMAERNDPTA
jgi:hypothetical protein